MIIAYASAETRFVPLYSPWAADMQVKGQSGAADKMEVNQAKQEHLLALKGTCGCLLFTRVPRAQLNVWSMLRFIHKYLWNPRCGCEGSSLLAANANSAEYRLNLKSTAAHEVRATVRWLPCPSECVS